MKIEEEENALKFLIDAIENSNGESFSEAVFEHFGSDTINVLTVLKENDLIDFHRMGNDLRCFRITSEGQKYFDKKDQAKRTYWKSLIVSHVGNIIESAIVSLITALITLKLSGK